MPHEYSSLLSYFWYIRCSVNTYEIELEQNGCVLLIWISVRLYMECVCLILLIHVSLSHTFSPSLHESLFTYCCSMSSSSVPPYLSSLYLSRTQLPCASCIRQSNCLTGYHLQLYGYANAITSFSTPIHLSKPTHNVRSSVKSYPALSFYSSRIINLHH